MKFTVSQAHISKAVDKAMDKADAKSDYVPSGVAVRNGPVVEDKMDIDEPATNGNAKRKARASISKPVKYTADSESDEDAIPLVCTPPSHITCACQIW
jgi:DNA topoisomerase-1